MKIWWVLPLATVQGRPYDAAANLLSVVKRDVEGAVPYQYHRNLHKKHRRQAVA